MADISEVLLRVVGDTADAETDLARLTAELEAFNNQEADAEISIDDSAFRAEIAKARAELSALDAQDVDIDVDSDSLRTTAARADTARGSIGGFSGSLGQLFGVVAKGAPIISGFGAILLALVSSLASAVLGAGALAVALASTLGPAVLLVIAAVRKYKDEADKAGTASNALKQAVKGLAGDFDGALGPAVDKVFGALAQVLPGIGGMLGDLRANFTDLGGAVGDLIKRVADFATSKASVDAFRVAIDTLTKLVAGPGGSAFVSLLAILRNIAEAASPLLVNAFKAVADGLRGLADRTSDIDSLRETIRAQVADLGDWLGLLKEIGRIFTGLFKAALPDGRELVEVMRQGAESLADWINSASGQNRIRDFLDQVIPVAREVLTLAGKLTVAFLEWSELTAPTMRLIFNILNSIADALNTVLGWLNKLPGPLDAIAGGLLLLGGGKILGALGSLVGALGSGVGGALSGLLGKMTTLIGKFGLLRSFGLTAFAGVQDTFTDTEVAASGLTIAIGDTATEAATLADKLRGFGIDLHTNFVPALEAAAAATKVLALRAASNFAELFKAGKEAVGRLIDALQGGGPKAIKAADGVAHGAVAVIEAASGDFKGAGQELIEAFSDGQRNKEGAAKNAGASVARATKQAIGDFASEFHDVGDTSGDRYASGVSGKEGASKNAGSTIARAARQAIADFASLFNDEGSQAGDRYASGVGSKDGAARGSGSALARAVKDGLTSLDFGAVAGGIVSRILGGFGGIVGALRNLGVSAINAFISGFTSRAVPAPNTPSGGGGGGGKRKVADVLLGGLASSLEPALAGLAVAVAPTGVAGRTTINQTFNIPPAPAAHGQPDARHTAAQLALAFRRRGGRWR